MITISRPATNCWLFPSAIAGLVWLCFYRLSGGFGFYSDDLHFFGIVINFDSIHSLGDWVTYCWSKWPQGRPMGYTAMYTLGFFADRVGGMVAFQCIGFALAVTNALLFHRLIARFVDRRAAVPATLFFALGSIATVQPVFTFSYYYDVATPFMLLACNTHVSRWRPFSYLFLALAMLSQEPSSITFLFFPWLVLSWDRAGLKRWLVHSLCWTLVIGVILVLRWKIGDPWGSERVAQLAGAPGETLIRSLKSIGLGFLTHLQLIGSRPLAAIREITIPGALVMLAAIPVLGWLLRDSFNTNSATEDNVPTDRPLRRMAFVGAVCMSLPYAAYFRDYWYPCSAETGFFSAVHVMAKFGGALVVGAALSSLRQWAPIRHIATLAAVFFFASWISFGQLLQTDYVRNQSGQMEMWNAVYRLCPDLGDSTDVLIIDKDRPPPHYMNQFCWVDELTPARLFVFPSDWARAPRVYQVNADLASYHISFDEGQFKWLFHPSILNHAVAQKEIIKPGTVIILRWTATGYERVSGDFPVKDGMLPLKSLGPTTLPAIPRRPFARYFNLPPTAATLP